MVVRAGPPTCPHLQRAQWRLADESSPLPRLPAWQPVEGNAQVGHKYLRCAGRHTAYACSGEPLPRAVLPPAALSPEQLEDRFQVI